LRRRGAHYRRGVMLARIDAWQRRHRWAAFAVAVGRKFGDDRGSSLAALVAYYAFLSLFPLLLALVSALGFVLEDDPELQADIVDSALARIPVIGTQLEDDLHPLTGNGVALAIGIAGALWAGLGVTLALGRAFDDIWDVPRREQRGWLAVRVRGALVLVFFAFVLVTATVAGGIAIAAPIAPAAERAGTALLSVLVNAAVFLAAFRVLTARPPPVRDLLPGVAFAAVGWLVLQAVGGVYVTRVITGATDAYGTFALVIGLLSWFWLASHLLLLGAELNVVRAARLWPRSLTGELEPADRAAMQRYAEAVRQER
jgi:membrane protein